MSFYVKFQNNCLWPDVWTQAEFPVYMAARPPNNVQCYIKLDFGIFLHEGVGGTVS